MEVAVRHSVLGLNAPRAAGRPRGARSSSRARTSPTVQDGRWSRRRDRNVWISRRRPGRQVRTRACSTRSSSDPPVTLGGGAPLLRGGSSYAGRAGSKRRLRLRAVPCSGLSGQLRETRGLCRLRGLVRARLRRRGGYRRRHGSPGSSRCKPSRCRRTPDASAMGRALDPRERSDADGGGVERYRPGDAEDRRV